MKYYRGDIVELINGGGDLLIVGQRYRLELIPKYGKWMEIDLGDESIASHRRSVKPSQIRLYHRPFRNWLKHFFNL